jgi:hypothetical protein
LDCKASPIWLRMLLTALTGLMPEGGDRVWEIAIDTFW